MEADIQIGIVIFTVFAAVIAIITNRMTYGDLDKVGLMGNEGAESFFYALGHLSYKTVIVGVVVLVLMYLAGYGR